MGYILADSHCCFLPYSFAKEDNIMTSTSFPSKLIDYLAWARRIVVYAPKSSIPFTYFKKYVLDFAIDDSSELYRNLLKMINFDANFSSQYRAILELEHEPKRLASRILYKKESLSLSSINPVK